MSASIEVVRLTARISGRVQGVGYRLFARRQAQARPVPICPRKGLLQRSADAYKVRAELVAETVHGGDDRNRDTGCNQAIFNGRGS